jgi:hypothetical protein
MSSIEGIPKRKKEPRVLRKDLVFMWVRRSAVKENAVIMVCIIKAQMVFWILKLHEGIHTNRPSQLGRTNEPYRDSSTEKSVAIGEGGDKGTHCAT